MSHNRRYALATDKDAEAGLIWSTGGVWTSSVPEAERLMTGPEVDAFAARQHGAVIVDVITYRDMCEVYRDAFNKAIQQVGESSEWRMNHARQQGRNALEAAGYRLAAAKANPFNPCEI